MLTLNEIRSWNDPRLARLLTLYQEAFPAEERREISALQRMFSTEPNMHLCAVETDEQGLCGLFFYWTFEGFNYFEHLAVFPELRNLRLGEHILRCAHQQLSGPCLLEVEPADSDELAARRIGFYERNDYRIIDKTYHQPSYRQGEQDIALWIMAHRFEGSADTLKPYLQTIRKRVYLDQR